VLNDSKRSATSNIEGRNPKSPPRKQRKMASFCGKAASCLWNGNYTLKGRLL
jgi:hypothetical protein